MLKRTSSELDKGPQTPDKFGRNPRQISFLKSIFTRKANDTPLVSPKLGNSTNTIQYYVILGDLTEEIQYYQKAVAEQTLIEQTEGRPNSPLSPRLAKYRKMLENRGVLFGGVLVHDILKEEMFSMKDYKDLAQNLYDAVETKNMSLFDTIEKIFNHGVTKYTARAQKIKKLKHMLNALAIITAPKNAQIVTDGYGDVSEQVNFVTDLKKLYGSLNSFLEKENAPEEQKRAHEKMVKAVELLLRPESIAVVDALEYKVKETITQSLQEIHLEIGWLFIENNEKVVGVTDVLEELCELIKEYKGKRATHFVMPVTIVNIDDLRRTIEDLKNTDDEKEFSLTPPMLKKDKEEEEFSW